MVRRQAADRGTDALRVEHVAKRFGALTALRDVNLRSTGARCSA